MTRSGERGPLTERERHLLTVCIDRYIEDIRRACEEDQGTPDGEPGTVGRELQDDLRALKQKTNRAGDAEVAVRSAQQAVQAGPADLRQAGDLHLRDAGREGLTGEAGYLGGFLDGLRAVAAAACAVAFEAASQFVHAGSVNHLTHGVQGRKVVYMDTQAQEATMPRFTVESIGSGYFHAIIDNRNGKPVPGPARATSPRCETWRRAGTTVCRTAGRSHPNEHAFGRS
jgi:hypothetical protein